MEELDIIINEVLIVEGTGKEPYIGNIGIKKDKITRLGKEATDSKKIINGVSSFSDGLKILNDRRGLIVIVSFDWSKK